jgi:hypothetical protein
VQSREDGLALAIPPEGKTHLGLGGETSHQPQVAQNIQQMAVTVVAGMGPRLHPETATRRKGLAVDATPDPLGRLQDQGLDAPARRTMGQPQATDTTANDDMLESLAHEIHLRPTGKIILIGA